jgi:hypothetical protein
MVIISPVNTGIPHTKRSSLQKWFPSTHALILWQTSRDSLMIGSAQERWKARCELSQSVEPGGGSRLSPSLFNICLEQVYPCSSPVSRGLVLSLLYKVVVRKLIASTCELCALKDEHCVVHQVRKLADLTQMGKDRPLWAHIMLKKRRKTLIVCQTCHATIHDG